MKINGKPVSYIESETLRACLERLGFDPARVAVERNGTIVPKNEFSALHLAEEDSLEVVSFVGGG